jgi:hypothetical protein
MSKFFLNNQSLNINDFEIFKNGIIQLMSIEKMSLRKQPIEISQQDFIPTQKL